ncbi:hypothetical protein AVEN_194537-1 [Araneus ventricosus]|uniref:Uncharacterized protein n=1 Tax=Araneus ventricosus TaxID=182803 RepID=A0A4Y2A8S3_ARAVE|nr:hypothetical protein AVEN_194537-1 [Araneus ventricosus]
MHCACATLSKLAPLWQFPSQLVIEGSAKSKYTSNFGEGFKEFAVSLNADQCLKTKLRVKTFSGGVGVLLQDLAPCYNSKLVKKFQEKKFTVLDWPGDSPTVNSSKNLWSIVKRRVSTMDCSTKGKMIENVVKVWFRDDDVKNACSKLVESMPHSIQDIIEARGGHIFY